MDQITQKIQIQTIATFSNKWQMLDAIIILWLFVDSILHLDFPAVALAIATEILFSAPRKKIVVESATEIFAPKNLWNAQMDLLICHLN